MADSADNPLAVQPDGLLPAAMRAGASRGRPHHEAEHPYRNPYQRDRDRVVHSAHFRRLEYKTQVFVNGEGDNYRTRLTHTLEVAQVARGIARALHLNEDLAEAVALSHDLGHTPFGHGGERELNSLLADEGGFNHNAQGLRVVDVLENRYMDFPGLNLTYEVREGFVRHGGPDVAGAQSEFAPADAPLLEVAVTIAADDIAYIAHDLDDGLFSRILDAEELTGQALWRRATAGVAGFGALSPSLKRTEGVRRLINLFVTDLVGQVRANLAAHSIDSPEKARGCPVGLIQFSDEVESEKKALKKYLFSNFYRHPNIMRRVEDARRKLGQLFQAYAEAPEKMPVFYREIADNAGNRRAAADYVAGMTDRFADGDWARNCGGGA